MLQEPDIQAISYRYHWSKSVPDMCNIFFDILYISVTNLTYIGHLYKLIVYQVPDLLPNVHIIKYV